MTSLTNLPEPAEVERPYRRAGDHRPLAVGILAYALLYAALFSAGRLPLSSALGILWVGLQAGIAPLAATWCWLGCGPWWIRGLGSVLLLGMVLATTRGQADIAMLYVVQFLVAGVPLGVLRSLRLRLDWPPPVDPEARPLPLHFTLRHMALWMVAGAVLFAALRQLQLWTSEFFGLYCVLPLLLAVVPWGVLWAVFGPRQQSFLRWLTVATLWFAAGCSAGLTGTASGLPYFWLAVLLVQLGATASILLAARRCGLRWVR